jgi:hypothetical protein
VAIGDEENIGKIAAVFDYQDSRDEERMVGMQVGGDNVREIERRSMCIQKVSLGQ